MKKNVKCKVSGVQKKSGNFFSWALCCETWQKKSKLLVAEGFEERKIQSVFRGRDSCLHTFGRHVVDKP